LDLIDPIDEKKRRIAFHEAGHAWMMVREGLGVRSVSLKPPSPLQADNRGHTVPEQAMEEGRPDICEKFARAALAGSMAEHYMLGNWDDESLVASAYDTGRARSCLSMAGDDIRPDALSHYIHSLQNAVLDEISQAKVWHMITALAYELLASECLTGQQVRELLSDE
jgi:hypothetical protein